MSFSNYACYCTLNGLRINTQASISAYVELQRTHVVVYKIDVQIASIIDKMESIKAICFKVYFPFLYFKHKSYPYTYL